MEGFFGLAFPPCLAFRWPFLLELAAENPVLNWEEANSSWPLSFWRFRNDFFNVKKGDTEILFPPCGNNNGQTYTSPLWKLYRWTYKLLVLIVSGRRRWLNKHCCIMLYLPGKKMSLRHADTLWSKHLRHWIFWQPWTCKSYPYHPCMVKCGWYGIKCHGVPHLFHPREGWWFPIPRNMRVGNTDSHYKDSTWMNGNQWTHKFCLDKQTSTTNSKQLVFNPVPNSFREVVDCLLVGGWATQFDKYGQIGSFPHKSGWK